MNLEFINWLKEQKYQVRVVGIGDGKKSLGFGVWRWGVRVERWRDRTWEDITYRHE